MRLTIFTRSRGDAESVRPRGGLKPERSGQPHTAASPRFHPSSFILLPLLSLGWETASAAGGPLTLPLAAVVAVGPAADPMSIGAWLVSAGAVLWILNESAKFADRFRERPRTEVHISGKVVTGEDIKLIERGSKDRKADSDRQIKAIETASIERKSDSDRQLKELREEDVRNSRKIDERFSELNAKRSTDVSDLHDELSAARVSIGGLMKGVEFLEKQQAAADQKLTAILQRLPQVKARIV